MTGQKDAREMIRTIGLTAGKSCGIRPPQFGDYKKIADLAEPLGYPSAVKQVQVGIERTWSEILHCSHERRDIVG